MMKTIRGVEVDIVGHNFEHSPDINVFGCEYVTATLRAAGYTSLAANCGDRTIADFTKATQHMSDLEPDYKRDRGQSSGSNTLYTVEARYNYSKAVQICGQLFDQRWTRVHFKTHDGIGVPNARPWHELAQVDGMLAYASAEAMRWWFHAEAEQCLNHICLETRLIKHEINWSQTITAVSQHCEIGGKDRSNIVPDWGTIR